MPRAPDGTYTLPISDFTPQTLVKSADVNAQFKDIRDNISTWNGNFNFAGASRRITSDFSNPSQTLRTLFQSSTVDGPTSIGAIPNGAGAGGNFTIFGKSDPLNSPLTQITNDGTNVATVGSGKTGTGAMLPLLFLTGGFERFRLDANANRYQADFSSSPYAVRHLFQTNAANAPTSVGVIPNGTSTVSQVSLYSKPDPDNAQVTQLYEDGANTYLSNSKTGTGAYGGLNLATSGSVRYNIDASGNHNISGSNFIVGIPSTINNYLVLANTGAGAQISFQLYLKALNYAPHIRSNNTLSGGGGIEFINGANSYQMAYMNEAGWLWVRQRVQSYNGAVGNQNCAFQSLNQGGWSYSDWRNSPVAVQVDASDPSSAYYGMKWTRWGDRHFAAISGIQNSNNTPSVQIHLDNGYGTGGWAWMIYAGGINRGDGYYVPLNAPSDYRLKDNVVDLQGSVDRIMALRPVEFDWKDGHGRDTGFIAHEAQQVEPRMVEGEKDAVRPREAMDGEGEGDIPVYQKVNPQYLIPDLVATIQQLKREIDELKAARIP